MFQRKVVLELEKWSNRPDRKPLVLRGARQVGKTSAVDIFSKRFAQYVYLNLEKPENRHPFRNTDSAKELVQAIFLLKNKTLSAGQTLLFIDEIQEEPRALEQLRYFHEELPELVVICAGSLLETVLNRKVNVPVGRAEYMAVRPVSFPEFLEALGEHAALRELHTIPVRKLAHDKLLKLFHTYALIGGMPEIVAHYVEHQDITRLRPVYESLIVSYMDDVEKYARSQTQLEIIRHAIRAVFNEAASRVKFAGFGRSNYGSRESGEALRTLQQAMLLQLVYPTTDVRLPFKPDRRKSPKLLALDTGLMNYFSGLQPGLLGTADLNNAYQGRVAEHLVAQELLASTYQVISRLSFWVREEKHATAEVDFVYPYGAMLVPLEVKSGAAGSLRSLHEFMDRAPHHLAVRLSPMELSVTNARTPSGKVFRLLNLPYYLVSQLEGYLDWLKGAEAP